MSGLLKSAISFGLVSTFCLSAAFAQVSAPDPSMPASEPPQQQPTETAPDQDNVSPIGIMPTRGMNQAEVVRYFGEPEVKHPPVGQPAIIRWDYDGFAVYFENDYTLHSLATQGNEK